MFYGVIPWFAFSVRLNFLPINQCSRGNFKDIEFYKIMEESSPVKVFKTREAVAIIFLCGFLLIPTAFALSSLRIQGAEEEERSARLPVPPTATPSPVVKVDNSYGQAIAQAMSAANLVQSASSQDDWKLVVSRWQKSISLLKSIAKADPNYAKAQTKAVEYQKNLAYAQVRMGKPGQSAVVAVAPVPSVAKPGIEVSRYEIQSAFDQPNVGFIFEASSPVHGEERVMGKAPNGTAVVELIGDTQNLSSATLVFVGQGSQDQLKLSSLYALLFLEKTAPTWNGMQDWLADAASEMDNKDAVSVIEGDRLISLKKFGSKGLLLLIVKPVSEGG